MAVLLGLLLLSGRVFGALFSEITSGSIVTDREGSFGFAWVDYDGDGDLDVLVTNNATRAGDPLVTNSLYRNDGEGTFTKVTVDGLTTIPGYYRNALWADCDNDGDVDVFVAREEDNSQLYRNDGGGQFTGITADTGGTPVSDGSQAWDAAWLDYDADGILDLFVTKWAGGNDRLYRGLGDGTFLAMTKEQVGPIVSDQPDTGNCAAVDYDNDGDPDIFRGWTALGQVLWRNDDGFFTIDSPGSLSTESSAPSSAWGDYDNDGYLDVFVPHSGAAGGGRLHRNAEGMTFVDVTTSSGIGVGIDSLVGTWGDYDNDGFLDLFVASYGGPNALFHNNGDGTFTRAEQTGLDFATGRMAGAGWGDYDNDGFLDLFVALGDGDPEVNHLFRNSANENHWLKVRLDGVNANRSGIGAKIRVRASFGGRTFWQTREIVSVGGYGGTRGHPGLLAHFGLGDATVIDTLRIEWPSGIVQELTNVAPNQTLTLTEPPRLIPQEVGGFQIQCWINQSFDVQCSEDLKAWTTVGTVTNETGTLIFQDPQQAQHTCRYYRVVAK